MPDDRFLAVVVKGDKAKLRPDVILDNTPNIVKAMFRDACEKKLATLVAPEKVEQVIVPEFAQYGITREQLEMIVGRPAKLGWRESERLELRKIMRALKDGETTAAELLDGLQDANGHEPPKPQGGGVSPADFAPKSPVLEPASPPPISNPVTATAPIAPPSPPKAPESAPVSSNWQPHWPETWRETYDHYRTKIAAASGLRPMMAMRGTIKDNPAVPEEMQAALLQRCVEREEAIRNGRGDRSNGG